MQHPLGRFPHPFHKVCFCPGHKISANPHKSSTCPLLRPMQKLSRLGTLRAPASDSRRPGTRPCPLTQTKTSAATWPWRTSPPAATSSPPHSTGRGRACSCTGSSRAPKSRRCWPSPPGADTASNRSSATAGRSPSASCGPRTACSCASFNHRIRPTRPPIRSTRSTSRPSRPARPC